MEIEGAQASTPRPLRADARQNYERLIAAAAAAIGELGPNVSLEEVAKRAGVGIGTLYRHFPNRQALLEAVYREQVERHSARGRELLTTRSPVEALPLWLHSLLTYNLTMRGLKEALMAGEIAPQTSDCKAQMHAVGGELLAHGGQLNGDRGGGGVAAVAGQQSALRQRPLHDLRPVYSNLASSLLILGPTVRRGSHGLQGRARAVKRDAAVRLGWPLVFDQAGVPAVKIGLMQRGLYSNKEPSML